jgi:hypothetical protein
VLQLSGTALLGSLGAMLGSQGLLLPAQPAWAAGGPQELAGPVRAAVDKALDKFVAKAKVGLQPALIRRSGLTALVL